MEKKTERLWIRVSKPELAKLHEKGKQYGSVSAMIRKAVASMNDISLAERENRKNELLQLCRKLQTDLSRAGNNLNQIAKSMNILKSENIITDAYLEDVVLAELQEIQSLLQYVKLELFNITKSTVRGF